MSGFIFTPTMSEKISAVATAAATASGAAAMYGVGEAQEARLFASGARILIPVATRLVPILAAAGVAYAIYAYVIPYIRARYGEAILARTLAPIDWSQWELIADCGRRHDVVSHNFVFGECQTDTITSGVYMPDEWKGEPTSALFAWQLDHVGLDGQHWWLTAARYRPVTGVIPTRDFGYAPLAPPVDAGRPWPIPARGHRPYGQMPARSAAIYAPKPLAPINYQFSHAYAINHDGTVDNHSRPAPILGGVRAPFYGLTPDFRPAVRPVPGVRPIVSNPTKPFPRPIEHASASPKEAKFAQTGASKSLIRAFSATTQGLQDAGDFLDVVYQSIPYAPKNAHRAFKVKFIIEHWDEIDPAKMLALYAYNLMEDAFVGSMQHTIDKGVFGGKLPGAFSNLTKSFSDGTNSYQAINLAGMQDVKNAAIGNFDKYRSSFSKGKENSL